MFGRKDPAASEASLQCSFCYKNQRDVKKLIAGPTVFICDECVEICNTILKEDIILATNSEGKGKTEEAENEVSKLPSPALSVQCSLCRTVSPLEGAIMVSDRGFLCRVCVDAVQEVLDEWKSK